MKRKIIQLYSALIYNAHLKGFITGEIYRGNAKFLCVPGLNCYSCPAAVGACPLGALQNALGSLNHRTGYYIFGIILLYGLILGRTVCGWICPFGLLQEILYKIPAYKLAKSKFTRALSYMKFFILAIFVITMPLYYAIYYDIPVPAFCKYICPAGTFEGALGLLANSANSKMLGMLGFFFTSKFIIMIIFALACIFCYRTFCRFICPLGAIYGLFNKLNFIGVKVNENLCINCGACIKNCKMDVNFIGDHECINCGECMKFCNQKAISFSVHSGKKSKSIIFCITLIFLCSALVWFNNYDSGKIRNIGHEVGQSLPDFSIKCLDGTEFNLSENRGKVIIINLWATYCAPCIKELPYFDALYREHKENLEVIAVHSSLVIDDVTEFLTKKNFAIKFAVDSDNDLVWKIVNGSSTLPQTIILNRNGEIIYNQIGSITPEKLLVLYQEANEL